MGSKGKNKGEGKEKKLSDKEAEEMIVAYLNQKQNRPYNAQMIMDNLHGVIGKTQANKVLSSLSDKDIIVAKGEKAKIYWRKQEEQADDNGEETVREIEADIAKLTTEHAALTQEFKDIDTPLSSVSSWLTAFLEIKGLNNRMTEQELDGELKRLTAENKQLSSKLEGIKSNSVSIQPQDRKKIEARYTTTRKAWSTRKRKCKEILDGLAEAGKAKKDLLEEIDFETDESKGVDLGEDLLAKRLKTK